MPKTWNDTLSLLLLVVIPGLWVAQGYKLITLPGEIIGALIATWTLIIQFYFRRAPPDKGNERLDNTTPPANGQ